jgi:hypothetical protein
MTAMLNLYVDAYKNSDCEEELTYKIELIKPQIPKAVWESNVKVYIASKLATNLLNYAKGKMQVRQWAQIEPQNPD